MAYESECATLTCSLALGELETALECCRRAVSFLETALGHVPSHPLLALQRFTLGDLELACASNDGAHGDGGAGEEGEAPPGRDGTARDGGGTGGGNLTSCVECADTEDRGKHAKDGRARALEVMIECAKAIEISSASRSSLRATARERLEDLRALAPTQAAAEPVLC